METKDFNYGDISRTIGVLVEMMDRVVDLTDTPLVQQKEELLKKRRIGMGVLGYGSALMLLGLKYGSDEALSRTNQLLNVIMNSVYHASAMLARNAGKTYEGFSLETFKKSYIYSILDKSVQLTIDSYGLRNSHLMAMAPTGNTSIYAGIVSGGIEPVFNLRYIRTKAMSSIPDDIDCPDYLNGHFEETSTFKWQDEGTDRVLRAEINNTVYKIDPSRGLVKESVVEDYAYRQLKDKIDNNDACLTTAMDLSIDDHLNTLALFAQYTDQGVSKTINVSSDCLYDDFKDIYTRAYIFGIKGLTTYRDGTMSAVLSNEKPTIEDESVLKENVELPANFMSRGKVCKAEGKKWYIHISEYSNGRPYAVFCNTNNTEPTVLALNAIETLEELAKQCGIPEKWVTSNKEKMKNQANSTKIARSLSLLLRHRVPIVTIVSELEKVNAVAGTFVYQIRKILSSYIKRGSLSGALCPECNEPLIYAEGCKTCKSCGYSAC